jgi:hypothetical protein
MICCACAGSATAITTHSAGNHKKARVLLLAIVAPLIVVRETIDGMIS